MSSSRGVGLYLTFLLALLCNVSEEAPEPVQREVTDMLVDEDVFQKELPLSPEELDFLMMQRPIMPDLSKVMASSDMTQREVTNFHPENVPIGHPVFGPRSMGPKMGPKVDFPPSFPNTGNLQEICQFSKAPARYQKETFPQSGFGREHRQADAVNQLQSWYSVCCGIDGTQEEQICCAEQAWKKSLSAYCNEEFSIKTSHFFCCKKNGKARWSCFDKEASDSSYHVSSEVSNVNTPLKVRGFKYNSSACKGSLVASPRAPRKQPKVPDFIFPPGRPNSSNIEHICTHHKIRPRYNTKCLPCTGYGWLVRQSKAINVLEREYNQCCKEKKGEQSCAEKKWKKMVDKFCKDEKKTKGPKFECCGEKKREEQYACFASAAPDPGYNSTDRDLSAAAAAPPTLHDLCDTHTTIKSMKGFPFSVDKMVERCCPLVLQERPACIEAKLDSHLNDLCKAKELVKLHCCEPTIKQRAKCATKLLLRYIDKANKVKNSGRKKCPLMLQFPSCHRSIVRQNP